MPRNVPGGRSCTAVLSRIGEVTMYCCHSVYNRQAGWTKHDFGACIWLPGPWPTLKVSEKIKKSRRSKDAD